MSYLSAPEVLIMISNDDANHAFASKTKPSVFGSTFIYLYGGSFNFPQFRFEKMT